jgi:hypothetical protein
MILIKSGARDSCLRAELRKATIRFFMYVRLSVCSALAFNNSAATEWILIKFDIWTFFEKLSAKFH